MKMIEDEIISNSRHQIIYSDDCVLRKELFMSIEKNNPICTNINKPFSVYVEDLGPNLLSYSDSLDKIKLSSMSREYLYFEVCYEIINKIKSLELDEELLKTFLERINSLFTQNYNILSLDELANSLLSSKEIYGNGLNHYSETGNINFNISDMNIPFIDLENFIKKIKKLINNQSYLCLLLNHEKDISIYSMKSVNNLIASRINKDISVKLGTANNAWKTYYADNNEHIDSVHDYDIIYLDGEKSIPNKEISKEF